MSTFFKVLGDFALRWRSWLSGDCFVLTLHRELRQEEKLYRIARPKKEGCSLM
jgi:hypothetical protein